VKRLVVLLIVAAAPLALALADWVEIRRAQEPPTDQPARVVGQGERAGMVLVSAGAFVMGGDDSPDQSPVRRLWLPAFLIDRTEVTAAAFDTFVQATDCPSPGPPLWVDDVLRADLADHPAYPITWEDAHAYCRAQGKRLATETEWEKAARGSDSRIYPWGGDFDPARVNHRAINFGLPVKSRSVGSYPAGASPYGALDMAGNVREWVSDVYESEAYNQHRFTLPAPWVEQAHALRGGSFMTSPDKLTTYHRSHAGLDPANADQGFRCAVDE
jgi:formylglycine-generating enzyme required for sulfatase activity